MTPKTGKRKNFIAAVEVNTTNKDNLQINDIRSVYPRNDLQVLKSINNKAERNYFNKEKMLEWLGKQQFNSAEVAQLSKQGTNVQKLIEDAKAEVQTHDNPISDADVAKETEGLRGMARPMQTKSGEILGFVTPDGKVYLDTDNLRTDTPIHEFGHVWERMLPNTFSKGVELLKNTQVGKELFKEVRGNKAYEHLDNEGVWREALVKAIGDKNEKVFNGGRGAEIKQWLSDMWAKIQAVIEKSIGKPLGFKVDADTKLDAFVSDALRDITGIRGEVKGEKPVSEGEINFERTEKNTNLEHKIIGNDGKINYTELKRGADAIERGSAHLDRLSPSEEQGRTAGGRRNVEASLLLRRKNPTGESEIRKERKEQERILKEYAQKTENWITPKTVSKWKPVDEGMESRIYDDGKSVIKIGYNYLNFYDTPRDFLDNKISLHNSIFPGTPLELIGFTQTHGANGKGEFFAPVYKQPYIHGRELRPNEQHLVDVEMQKRGFKRIGKNDYANKDYVIKDLHPENIIVDKDDNYHFIDTAPMLNTPERGFGGKRKYGSGEITGSRGTNNVLLSAEGQDRKAMAREMARQIVDNYTGQGFKTVPEILDAVSKKVGKDLPEGYKKLVEDAFNERVEKNKEKTVNEEESENGDSGYTSIKNKVIDAEREAEGKKPLTSSGDGTMEHFEKTKERIKSGDISEEHVRDLSSALATGFDDFSTKLSVTEMHHALLYDRNTLQRKGAEIDRGLTESREKGDKRAEAMWMGKRAQNEVLLENNDLAARRLGREWSDVGRARQLLIRQDYTLEALTRKYKAANGKGEIPEHIKDKLRQLSKEIESHNLSIEEMQKKQAAADAEIAELKTLIEAERENRRAKMSQKDAVDDLKKEVKSQVKVQGRRTIEKIKFERENIKNSLKDKWKKYYKGDTLGANKFIPVDMVPDLIKLAKSYIEEGLAIGKDIVLDKIIDRVHKDVVDAIGDIDKTSVRDAITGYGKIKKPNNDPIEVAFRDIAAQGRLVSGIELANKGENPLKSGQQRDEPTPEQRRLQKELNKAIKDNNIQVKLPEEQIKTSLDATKTRLRNQIEDYVPAKQILFKKFLTSQYFNF